MSVSLNFVKKKKDFMARKTLNPDWDYPPLPYLEQILNHCCRAAQTYLWLWNHSDQNRRCRLRSSTIADMTMISRARFKNSLREICREGLLSFREHNDILEIELVAWDEEFDN